MTDRTFPDGSPSDARSALKNPKAEPARSLHRSRQSLHDSALETLSSSESLQPLIARIARVGPTTAPVLVIGETGTGKELVASAVHESSHRADKPLIRVNLAAVPLELAEAALFGHQRGAFTGATAAAPGYCRQAAKGTLFLDEIGEADLALQAKLLRFLDYGEIQPVGASQPDYVDVRIIAATNRDLLHEVSLHRFREDLFYRLNVASLWLPPLRERKEDIYRLLDGFLEEFNLCYGRACSISPELRRSLCGAHWPGNVRQLRAMVESLVLCSACEQLDLDSITTLEANRIGLNDRLPLAISKADSLAPARPYPMLESVTRQAVENAIYDARGNVREAAARLGVGRSTLYRWLKAFVPLAPSERW